MKEPGSKLLGHGRSASTAAGKTFMEPNIMRSWLSEQSLSSYMDPIIDNALLLDRASANT